MNLLSISTASDILSISLCQNDKLVQSFNSKNIRQHAELIVPSIKAIIEKANTTIVQLDGICVNLGPGSFTGLRVGLSTAKGIAFGADLKMYCYFNFEELAYQVLIKKKIYGRCAVLIPARKNEFYFAVYDLKDNIFTQIGSFELMQTNEFLEHAHYFDWILTDERSKKIFENKDLIGKIILTENDSYYGALLVMSNPQKYLCKDFTYLEPLYLKNFELKRS